MVNSSTDGAFFVQRYLTDPKRYVIEVLGVKNIEQWQSDLLDAVRAACLDDSLPRRFSVRSGHGVGKTALTAWLNKWFMSTRPDPQIVVTANTETQLNSKTWRELEVWNHKAKDGLWFDHTATRFMMKTAPKTWVASAIPWTKNRSEAFAGTHAKHVLYIFDEASAIDDVIWEVSEGAMTTADCWWFVFGNPTRNNGRFVECWGKYRNRWTQFEVDSRNVTIANQVQIKKWIEDEGEDSDFVRVRVRGLPPRSSMLEFIGPDDVENCINYQAIGYDMAAVVIGVDLARFGDDRNVMFWRQGRKAEILKTWTGLDGMQTASHIIAQLGKQYFDICFLDAGGLGGPILDRVRAIIGSEKIIGVNFGGEATNKTKWFNKRAEMWGDLREAMREGLQIPNDKDLKADLLGPLYFFSPTEQIKLERKEDMKKRGLASPDYGDALALTFAQKVERRHTKPIMDPERDYEYGKLNKPKTHLAGRGLV